MKLTVILSLACSVMLHASTWAQGEAITLELSDVTLGEVIKEIEENSSYRFFYNDELTDLNRIVSVESGGESIEEVLSSLFEDTDIGYTMMDNNVIVIAPKRTSEEQSQVPVKGTIKDAATDEALQGVNIYVEGTTHGTITDADGNFSLSNVQSSDILVVSYIGYLTQKIPVGDKQTIEVLLSLDVESIDEVVVIGYGTVKRSDLTGAISSIKAEELSPAANVNVTQMIQGKAAGVQVIQQSAQPGGGLSILIRGSASTNADNQPLYVIDGFPVSNEQIEPGSGIFDGTMKYSSGTRNPLNSINPNDIESIEILKDASATAIYGARAANGVILINTKRGTSGVNVSYNGRYSVQRITQYEEMLNAEEFMYYYDLHREQFLRASTNTYPYGPNSDENFNYRPRFSEEEIANAGEGTNWFDEITRPGFINDQNISVSGGNNQTKFFSSFNYFDQKGVVINNDLQRFSGRLNVNQTISDRIKFGLNTTASQIDNNNAALGTGYWEQVGVIGSALGFPSIYPVRDSLGIYSENELYANNPNPVSFNEIDDNTLERRLLGSAYAEIDIFQGLTIRPSLGLDIFSSNREQYLPKTFKFGASEGGRATKAQAKSFTSLFEVTMSYQRSFRDKHNLSAVGGYSYQRFVSDGFTSYATNFFTDAFSFNSLQTGSSVPQVSSYKNETVIASYYARAQYSYESRYLFTLTGRVDGSDRFGANNKYAFFPAIAVGWNLARESFMQNQATFNDLKIRISYGQTGNSSIGGNAFAYYGTSVNGRLANYQFDDVIYTGMGKTQQENPNLRWETTTEANLGLDYGLWNNRITGSVELFHKEISDLLYSQQLQIYQQVGNIVMNVGATTSRGYEFAINANLISSQDMQMSVNVNLSKYVDRWKERAPESIESLDDWIALDDYLEPAYYWIPDRIFQIGEEQPYDNVNYLPGSLVVKDLDSWLRDEAGELILDSNGRRIKSGEPDGRIDQADIAFLGTRDPELIFGAGMNFRYKGFDLTLFFNGMLNYWVADENYKFNVIRTEDIYGGFNRSRRFMDTWTPENQDGKIPLAIKNHIPQGVGYDAMMFNEISFLRLKNITIGYNIPAKVLGTSVRVYADITNLITWTNLEYMDPETITWRDVSQYSRNQTGLYAYPNARSFTFGLNVDF